MSTNGSHKCTYCTKFFTFKCNLKRHLLLTHKIDQRSVKNFKCNACNSSFKEERNLNQHKRKQHGESIDRKLKQHSCNMCGELLVSQNLAIHLQTKHDMKINTIQKEFACYQDFLTWKEDLEKKENCKFILNRGVKRLLQTKNYSFVCHRSGYFKSESKGVKRLKIQGSCKMNSVCPAAMKIKEHNDSGKCELNFTNTHVGHQMDLGHLTLSEAERLMFAEKIASKLPFDVILDDVQGSISEGKLERHHLLCKKDLHNIAKSFNLSSKAVCHPSDPVSVEAGVKKEQDHANSCVLLCKPKGEENKFSSSKAPAVILDNLEIVNESDSKKNVIIQESNKNHPFPTSSLNVELNTEWETIVKLVKTVDDCNLVKKHLKSLKTELSATRTTDESFQTNHSSTSANKNILPQRQLFSMRKNQTKEKVVVKPSFQKQ